MDENRNFESIAAVECLGGWCFQNNSKFRDEIKPNAVTKTGVHDEPIYGSELIRIWPLIESRFKPVLLTANK